MMASAVFTAASIAPMGRTRLIRGRNCFWTFGNKYAEVRYEELKGKLWVEVALRGAESDSKRWESIAAYPSVETARIAAEAAWRSANHA